MAAVRMSPEEVTETKIKGAEQPVRQFKADPPAGRKMSREEAMQYIFEKNDELMRRLT